MGAEQGGGPLSVQIKAQTVSIHKVPVHCSFNGLLSTQEENFLPTFSFDIEAIGGM